MTNALIVVAKRPAPGFTKTRLCPPLTLEQAAELYHCLMLDTFALAARLRGVDHTVAYTPSEALSYFQQHVPKDFRLTAQEGNDLGERLANAVAEHFDRGHRKVVIMNSDGPTLPLVCLQEAFTGLDEADITLGIGHDGGYYLIGMKQPYLGLFDGIAWSTSQVIPETIAGCRRLRLTVHQLPQWYDVDRPADLEQLRCELAGNPNAAPRSYAFLKKMQQ